MVRCVLDSMEEDTWTEVKITDEGVSVSLYEEDDKGNTNLRDELWFTHDEMQDPSVHRTYSIS